MRKNLKYLTIGIITISCFTGLILLNIFLFPSLQSNLNQITNDNREKQFEVTNISIFIDYSGAQENDFYQYINLTNYQTTAFDAIVNCCVIKVRDFSWGLYVEEINGVGNGWIYWINDDPPPNIPSNYFYLYSNDTLNWKAV
ncbi:MAG: hypothetical protein ACFFDB_10650 [Promethearchaeota archaeon]